MADVKLFRPQRLTDNPDGGGLATSTEVVDGQVNNLFDDITRIDRVNGEISLRETFVIASTNDTALYSDAFVTVQSAPLDGRVSVVLFRLKSNGNYVWNGLRDDAKNQVERYLDPSVITRLIPYDRQLEGGRAVLAFQRKELDLPGTGDVLALTNDATGAQEFICVQKVEHEVQTFTDSQGDFDLRVITMTTTQPLSQEFLGSQPNRFVQAQNSVVIRSTIASDAAQYKGVVNLAADAAVGAFNIKVGTIFAQLVPSATGEAAVVDALPAGVAAPVPSRATTYSVGLVPGKLRFHNGETISLYSAVMPGTFQITGDPRGTVIDDKLGVLKRAGDGSDGAGTVVGSIDYVAGQAHSAATIDTESTAGWVFQPAAPVSKAALTMAIPVSVADRGYVYTGTLPVLPEPGSMSLSYRAQGNWYVLQDDGSGALRGATSGLGSGLVSFATGSWSATLAAIPDAGSAIIVAFGGGSEYEIRTGDTSIQPPAIAFTVAGGNIEPGTFSCSWTAGGVTKTATANSAGVLSGDGTGKVVHSTGDVLLYPTVLPDASSAISCDYEQGTTEQALFNPAKTAGSVSLDLGEAVAEGSVRIDYLGYGPPMSGNGGGSQKTRMLVDDGAGALVDSATGTTVSGSSVNYSTGAIAFPPDFVTKFGVLERSAYPVAMPGRIIDPDTGSFPIPDMSGKWPSGVASMDATVVFPTGGPMNVSWKPASASNTPITAEAHDMPALTFDLAPLAKGSAVPGSVLFVFGGKSYFDRSGKLYYDLDAETGAATLAGTIDYAGARASLDLWTAAVSPALSIKALLVQVAPLPLAYVHGRTSGAPLRPGSFSVRATRYRDSATVSATADNDGNLVATGIHGTIDVTTGVFVLAFGAYVLDSSLSSDDKAQDWYDAANVDGDGYIWRPDEVIPGTVKYNCVVQTALPLDPEIIKINPVRLPPDGRVPIIRKGDTLQIRDVQSDTLDTGLTAGQVVTLSRDNLGSVALYDANGLGVPDSKFSADLAAGEVTMADPLDLTGYEEPLVALHEIYDLALCQDAQIDGTVTLSAPLTHAYTADNSVCSSVQVLGDFQARYEHLFAQKTWTNVWSDSNIGGTPTSGAQYSDVLYPLEVVNKNAITQRWALIFTSSTAFNIVGEELGVIGTGNTSTDVAPVSPTTSEPYFLMHKEGFGSGWSTGNVIRFNTVAAGAPIWAARTVLSGPAEVVDDRVRLAIGWDKD